MAERNARSGGAAKKPGTRKSATAKRSVGGWVARVFGWLALVVGAACVSGAMLGAFVFAYIYKSLPDIDMVQNYRPRLPLRVWSADGSLIAEFGSERRNFVPIEKMPQTVKNAILAAEDSDFYSHGGIKITGIVRAAIVNFTTGKRTQGGSTITQQVARNFYFSSERSYVRKLYEIVMAYKIENTLSKDQIFEIYANQIYLGHRAYGFSAAARAYFGKELEELSVSETAVLAGLPVAPASYNPYANMDRAVSRRNYVLGRMYTLNFIDKETYEKAKESKIVTARSEVVQKRTEKRDASLHAEYVAELARQMVYDSFGEEAYQLGLNVYTTIRDADQRAAYAAMRRGVLNYDRNRGFRGAEGNVPLSGGDKAIEAGIAAVPSVDGLPAAVVLSAKPSAVEVRMAGGRRVTVVGNGLKLVRNALNPRTRGKKLAAGDIVRLHRLDDDSYEISQIPLVECGIVSADFTNGAVRALVGGFDFSLNKFNHVTQAWRQPGSSFKPFITSAALEKGFSPSTILNDAPVMVDPALTGGKVWEPHNADKRFEGPMRLQVALAKSRNLPFVRVMMAIGPDYASEYVTRFGFEQDKHPPQIATALGAGELTPWQSLAGYIVFANGGYRVRPYIFEKVTDADGKVLSRAVPERAGDDTLRAIDARNAYMMHTLLNFVASSGTGARYGAAFRSRRDLGAKTGTSNDAKDVWFCAYGGTTAAVGWMGHDQPTALARGSTGGGLVLPIITEYMKTPLKDQPDRMRAQPTGLVRVDGDLFYAERPVPPKTDFGEVGQDVDVKAAIRDQLF